MTMDKFKLGDEVVRGPDWCYFNQDGGKGNVGVVQEHKPGHKWVRVKWPNGYIDAYQCYDGEYTIMFAPVIEEKIINPIVEKKSPPIKRLNESEFKDVLKELN